MPSKIWQTLGDALKSKLCEIALKLSHPTELVQQLQPSPSPRGASGVANEATVRLVDYYYL
jgi:hypothetical protein